MAGNTDVVTVRFRQPKECTHIGDQILVGGFVCPELGFDSTVMLLLDPADGTLSLQARCGCKVTESIGPLMERLADMLRRGHTSGDVPAATH